MGRAEAVLPAAPHPLPQPQGSSTVPPGTAGCTWSRGCVLVGSLLLLRLETLAHMSSHVRSYLTLQVIVKIRVPGSETFGRSQTLKLSRYRAMKLGL